MNKGQVETTLTERNAEVAQLNQRLNTVEQDFGAMSKRLERLEQNSRIWGKPDDAGLNWGTHFQLTFKY